MSVYAVICFSLMFWSDWGRPGRIERSGLDGSQRQPIIRGLKRPNGLSIDFARDRLYWTDAAAKTIEHCDLDGRDRQVPLSVHTLAKAK